MMLFRLIAVLAWLVASTLSARAGAHELHRDHSAMKQAGAHQSHADMMAAMPGMDHGASHTTAPDHEEDCETSCCDGLCLCSAAPVPSAIEPGFSLISHSPPRDVLYAAGVRAAEPGDLDSEGPPPRLL